MLLPLLNAVLSLFSGLGSNKSYPVDFGPNLLDGDEFDFIIVGAGSAGSVVANRLSEIAEWKILLLEAGGYPSAISEIPGLAFLLQDSNEDWQYEMEPSKTCCLGVQNHRCHCPRGKGLGGTSLINAMIYARSTRHDHERWVSNGNIGWDYDSALKYYKKIENLNMEHDSYYGKSGNLHITYNTSTHPIRQILINAYKELGYQQYNEDNPIGFKDNPLTIYEGVREHIAKAYLSHVKDRKNLNLALNAQVSKLLVNRQDSTVTGVEVKINDQIINIKARKEVILSTGTIISPTILMHSGIGPKEHLSELGIEVIRDLNVGENYHDHIGYPGLAISLNQAAVTQTTFLEMIHEVKQFLVSGKGRLATLDVVNLNGYVNTLNATDYSNVVFVHTPIELQDTYAIQQLVRCTRMPKEAEGSLISSNQAFPLTQIFPILLQPKSRGTIRLQNKDPFSKPLIVPNYFTDQHGEDLETLYRAINIIQKLTETKTLSSHNAKILDLDINNCRGVPPKTEEFWKCAIRNIAIGVYHPVGTCKMGPATDPMAVVDPQLRVHGVRGVRVIDGSIIPIVPSCNTNAPILMIAEKGSALIKSAWIKEHDEL